MENVDVKTLSAINALFEPSLENKSLTTIPNPNVSVLSIENQNTELQAYKEKDFAIIPTFQTTSQLLSATIDVKSLSAGLVPAPLPGLAPHPLILADRISALEALNSALSAARSLKQQIQSTIFDGPVCPYQRTLLEYLGPNFKCPTIDDLPLPRNFNPAEAIKIILDVDKKHDKQMTTHLQIMSAEAADTNFPGVTSQNLGHAFAVLSATSRGQEYIIDKKKTGQHLEFVELISKIPTDYIVEHPVIVAQKLVARYLEIHQD